MRAQKEKPPRVPHNGWIAIPGCSTQKITIVVWKRPSHYNVASNYHCANYCNQYKKAGWAEEISTNLFLNESQTFQGINCN